MMGMRMVAGDYMEYDDSKENSHGGTVTLDLSDLATDVERDLLKCMKLSKELLLGTQI
jgi:hypothetical protein